MDFARLLRDASEGLPVGGRKAVWEAGRPTVVHDLTAQKPRGFVTYERRCGGALTGLECGVHQLGCLVGCLWSACVGPCWPPAWGCSAACLGWRGCVLLVERALQLSCLPPPRTACSPLPYRPVEERLKDWKEVHAVVSRQQAAAAAAAAAVHLAVNLALLAASCSWAWPCAAMLPQARAAGVGS
jgi:hypothetical protein